MIYLLVHGAYQGGWIWKPVATRLRAAGHLVFAPSLDGCGERKHTVRARLATLFARPAQPTQPRFSAPTLSKEPAPSR